MTVTVETPQGEKTGSAVVGVVVTVGRQPLTSTIEQYGVRGEATVVEIAPGKFLFALLSFSGPRATEYLVEHTFGSSIRIDPKLEEVDRLNAKYKAFSNLRGVKPLPRANYPLLVAFGNIADPKSVREVKPNNFADAFGPGFRLKSITMEITEEPVTDGRVKKLLEWLDTLNGALIPTPMKPANQYRPEEQVGSAHFLRNR